MGGVEQQKAPLTALALGTLGLVVGYATVVLTGPTALANGRSCPMKDKAVCVGEGCQKHDCEKGECGKDCPGCANHG
jgi:hypothetical protein